MSRLDRVRLVALVVAAAAMLASCSFRFGAREQGAEAVDVVQRGAEAGSGTPSASGAAAAPAPARVEVEAAPAPAAGPADAIAAYACPDGFTFAARILPERAWLFLPDEVRELPAAPAASGARYAEGETDFRSEGGEVLLQSGATVHSGCRPDPARTPWAKAKLAGVDFRAVGNEPGWSLEIILGGTMRFVTDYGQSWYTFPTPEPRVDRIRAQTWYQADAGGHTLEVLLEGRECADSMSGEIFAVTVRVTLDGRDHNGCGRALF